jgi:prepilin peptidase CpaA
LTVLADAAPASHAGARRRGFPAALGVLLVAPALLSGWVASMPLPVLGWAAAFLFLAVERDVHCRRIPNWLTFPTLAFAVLYGAWSDGTDGALHALLGAAAAFALLLLPYAMRGLGAGDVKAAMALGALFGAGEIARVVLLAVGFGGVLALLRLVVRGGLLELGRRWLHSCATSVLTNRLVYFPPAPGSAATRGIPFAVAIALAVATHQILELSR